MRRERRSAETAPRASCAALAAAALLAAPLASAQPKDVPPPPRLDPAPQVFTITPRDLADKPADPSTLTAAQLAMTAAPARPPNAATLPPPTPGRGLTPIDEIIVIGSTSHLPDLGSRWRARQQAAEEDAKGRAHLTVLPLYDPDHPTRFESLLAPPEMQRMGYIDLFRVRFGHRAKPEE